MGEISIKFHVEAFQADLKRIDRATNRATMWGLREVGRQLKRAEKSKVPVYKGPGGVKRQRKGQHGPQQAGPVVGLLKSSIGSARSFRREGPGAYALVVGPRGGRVNLYKGKIERKTHFVQQSLDEVIPRAPAIMATGWERAIRSGR